MVQRCAVLVAAAICTSGVAAQPSLSTLVGIAVLPAETFADGPPSGAWLRAESLGTPLFSSQPVQGVSSLWPAGPDEWFALSDNGFGAKINSTDFLLRIYRLSVKWGSGAQAGVVSPVAFIQLSDPDRKLPFPIGRDAAPDRRLTGADLDPESLVRMPDGTFWMGDEFGPFLLHFAADGRLLEAPYEIAGMRGPDHPHSPPADAGERSAATVRRSRGFEGLAHFAGDLYAVIESGTGSDADAALIFEFNLDRHAFTGQRWRFPLADRDHALTELVSLAPIAPECAARFLAVERDGGHGPAAKIKRVHELHLAGNSVTSRVVIDLLDIANPQRLGSFPARFTFPYITTEAVWPITRDEVVLANDNNYPAGGGREGTVHDVTEFIRLRLASPLCR
jgi:glycerophosphoryl diester phosphodiesterase